MNHTTICQCEECQSRAEFLDSLTKFKTAAIRLSKYWHDDTAHTPDSLAFYPFKESFDEVVYGITEWHNVVRKAESSR